MTRHRSRLREVLRREDQTRRMRSGSCPSAIWCCRLPVSDLSGIQGAARRGPQEGTQITLSYAASAKLQKERGLAPQELSDRRRLFPPAAYCPGRQADVLRTGVAGEDNQCSS